ncbi:hypothetical protein [Pullulanibacillus camelliae]|uniref:hypothetical protein n=1 Tax=Pullulanibacillus camelliae TaxID=1707096 RepID=UPI001668EB85|nr:hypothetical protein [Pullulanibacillus camelliae]
MKDKDRPDFTNLLATLIIFVRIVWIGIVFYPSRLISRVIFGIPGDHLIEFLVNQLFIRMSKVTPFIL